MNKKIIYIISAVLIAVVIIFVIAFSNPNVDIEENNREVDNNVTNDDDKTTLTFAAHWTEDVQMNGIYDEDGNLVEKGLNHYLDEYSALNPDVEFQVRTIAYSEYENKLRVLDDAGIVPDIFQIYSPWGVSYAEEGMIAEVPEDIKTKVSENYISTAGVTINDEIMGIPGEINDFSLMYNKEIFKDAGVVNRSGEALAPTTWDDVLKTAEKTTEYDSNGNISQYGFAFTKDLDWAAVDPFLSLLFTNNGEYLSEDYSEALFNSEEGIEVLDGIKELFDNSYTDVNSNVWDFSEGKVAMAFIAPWTESVFKDQMGDDFEEVVGVAPVPFFEEPDTLQYSWFIGVMDKSKNKQEAWDFLRWFTTDIQEETNTTRYGDLLARTIKAIPAHEQDLENNSDVLEDNFFKEPFISQLEYSTPEPNVLKAAEIKKILMDEVQAAWLGKDSKQALDDAAQKVNLILEENK
ncbi:MAG: extracellular solute-binding protein [Patescibacteria group bacterium]|jgi:multiple sugar transport system substrate-binding protein|nr:extracellular solute-binding protein [Patescibacteria group bacterium]